MAKKIYVIQYWGKRFHIDIVDVVKETKNLYYVEKTSLALKYEKVLNKTDEGSNWTTNEAMFPKVKQNYVNEAIKAQRNNIVKEQDDLARLIKDAKNLGLKVEE